MLNKLDHYGDDEEIGTIGELPNDYFMLPAGSTILVHVYDNEKGDGILKRVKKYIVLEDISIETHANPFKVSFLGSDPNPNLEKEILQAEIAGLERQLSKLKEKLMPLVS